MIIFGGYGNLGVVHILDLTTMKWSSRNNVKYKRYSHTANVIDNSIYLFGGWDYRGYSNDLHVYNVNNKTLQKVITKGNIPSVRGFHGSSVIEKNVYIFGG